MTKQPSTWWEWGTWAAPIVAPIVALVTSLVAAALTYVIFKRGQGAQRDTQQDAAAEAQRLRQEQAVEELRKSTRADRAKAYGALIRANGAMRRGLEEHIRRGSLGPDDLRPWVLRIEEALDDLDLWGSQSAQTQAWLAWGMFRGASVVGGDDAVRLIGDGDTHWREALIHMRSDLGVNDLDRALGLPTSAAVALTDRN